MNSATVLPLSNSSAKACSLQMKGIVMIRKLKTGYYRLYSSKPDPQTGKRRNLGTFESREKAQQHEREVQYFKRKG